MPHITVYHFGACELDETRRQLRRGDEAVRVGPRVFDLLLHLARQSHRVVPHGELRATVWNGQVISEAAVHACVCRAREAIGDRDDVAPMIRTFSRYGYRLAAEVRTELRSAGPRLESGPQDATAAIASKAAPDAVGFFGRAAELEMLAAALDQAMGGQGSLAIVRGEDGIGKTRLAAELAQLARAQGIEVLQGQCDETDDAPAFWPWAQILRRYAAHREPDAIRAALGSAAADVGRIAPALRDRCPELSGEPPADPDQAVLRVHESLLAFVARAAAAEPLVVVIDDVQWADAASWRVLRALAEELPHTRALVLALCESGADDAGLVPLLARGRTQPPCAGRIELGGLTAAAVGELIAYVVEQPPPDEVAGVIAELAAGNPFVVLDTVRHLRALDVLPPQASTWPGRDAILGAGVSETVGAMVSRRLRRLDPSCRHVLAIAAVAGAEFTFTTVERVAASAGDAALPAIEIAAEAGLVVPLDRAGRDYRFSAPYLAAAIRQDLNPTRLAHLQAQLRAAPSTGG